MSAPSPARELPFWLRPRAVLAFIAGVTLIRMIVAAQTGLVRDEGYYALWSTAPALGYIDHPPMIAWMIALGRTVLGESEAAVRLLPVLAGGLTLIAVYRIGVLLLDLRSAAVAVVWFAVTVAAGLLFIAAPDAPLVLFWALTLWAVAEFVVSRNANWWLAAGLFAGLALLSKYSAMFLGAGLVLYLISNGTRRGWLRLWQVWAGGAIALGVFLPNLIWNAEREWASFAFQGRRLGGYGLDFGSMSANLTDLAAGQALATGLVLFIFALIGMVAFAVNRRLWANEGLALPILTSLPMIGYFIAYTARLRVEANWLVAVWPLLALAAAWAAVHLRPRPPLFGWPLALLRWLQVPLGIALVGLIYAQALWQPFDLPQHIDRTRDMRGWAGLEQQVAALAATHGAQWIATGRNDYGLTGELATYGRFAGTGLPVRQVDDPARWDFLPPVAAPLLEVPALYVHRGSPDTAQALKHFASAEPVGEAQRRQGDEVLQSFAVYLVSRPLPETLAVLTDR